MVLKTDWKKHLHMIRRREIEIVSSGLGATPLGSAIEFGAGDGYQTMLLAPSFKSYVSSDLNFSRLNDEYKVPAVTYKKLDADDLEGKLEADAYDIVFSSNLIEHLGNPDGFLATTRKCLKAQGMAVHIVPGRMVKVTYVLLFYINFASLVLDRLIGLFSGKKVFRGATIALENNINTDPGARSNRWRKLLLPTPHGNFRSHREEFARYGKANWQSFFERAGYRVERYEKGPAFSGYGFGWDRLRLVLERLGWASEHIFFLKKAEM